jgi:hypothetical protein
MHEIDLTAGAVLETGCVYIVPLLESLALPGQISASANPKSSTGRLDIFTRVMTDFGQEFDKIAPGYTARCGWKSARAPSRSSPVPARACRRSAFGRGTLCWTRMNSRLFIAPKPLSPPKRRMSRAAALRCRSI